MKNIDILGSENETLSIISDILYTVHGEKVSIRIIKNIDVNNETPFKIETFDYEELAYSEWEMSPYIEILLGVMKAKTKKIVYEFFRKSHKILFEDYSNLVHPNTSLAHTIRIGKGFLCSPGTVIAPYANIGNMVTLNRNVTIGHHTKISDFCSIYPGANIAGFCDIGEGVTIGMGANILDHLRIGNNTIVGAGSLVTKDLTDDVVAYGCPAKIIRKNYDNKI